MTLAVPRDRLFSLLLQPERWAGASTVHADWLGADGTGSGQADLRRVGAGSRVRERVQLEGMPLTGVPGALRRPFRRAVGMVGGGFEISWMVAEEHAPDWVVLEAVASVGGACRLRFDLDPAPQAGQTRVEVLLELGGEPNNRVVRRFLRSVRPVRQAAARTLLAEIERSLQRLPAADGDG